MTATRTGGRPRRDEQRLPFGPLERLIPLRPSGDWEDPWHDRIDQLATALAVHKKQVERWRRYGVTLNQADRLAVHLGLLPEIIEGWEAVCPC